MYQFGLDEDIDDITSETITTSSIPREYAINFETGQLENPTKIVEGSEALKVWAWLALHSERYMFPIYSWDYGSELDTIVGTSYSREYTKAKLQKILEDCLLVNPHITAIKNLEHSYNLRGILSASFTIVTDYGKEQLNV